MDLKKMQALLDAMTKKGGNKENKLFFKPKDGTNNIRIVPRAFDRNNPFEARLFHYLNGTTILSPRNYGDQDPIADFSDALIAQGGGKLSKDEYKAAKKFSPQTRYFALVIDRENESEGVKIWGFTQKVRDEIIGICLLVDSDGEPEYGDITNVEKGFDLTLEYISKDNSPTKLAQTKVTPKRKESPLSKDSAKVEAWLSDQPTAIDQYKKWTKDEMNEFLRNFLNPSTAQGTGPAPTQTATTEAATETTTPASVTPTPDVEDEFTRVFNS